MRHFLQVYAVFCILLVSIDANAVEVSSPDGRLTFRIQTGGFLGQSYGFEKEYQEMPLLEPEDGRLTYLAKLKVQTTGFRLEYQGGTILLGGLGLKTSDGNAWTTGQTIHSITQRSVNQFYKQPGHKMNPVLDHYNEVYFELSSEDLLPVLRAGIRVRVYDDGAAFRYELHPASLDKGSNALHISEDFSWFQPVDSFSCWPMLLPSYDTSYEALYQNLTGAELPAYEIIATPLLMELQNGISIALTEASLSDFPGMYLRAGKGESGIRLFTDLSKANGTTGALADISIPFQSPWRVIMVGESAGKLMESNLVLNLNEPSRLEDDSWIRFGKTTWNWWNGFYQEPVDFKVGANLKTIKHYIDFCADNEIEFHAIDCADASWTWYEQTQSGFAPGPDADILSPRPELQFFRALAYAKFREVGIRLWVHWKPLSERLEEAMEEFAKWGVEGLMVDFLDRDDQAMVKWAEDVLRVAAKHQIRIQFHGVWKPTGLRRTYPNLANHEGVLNLEYLKWSDLCTPRHNVTVPFTRMLVGPMDYHLGGFRSMTPETFLAQNEKPFVMGTRCHHLAMYVVYDNPVPMVSDTPTAYIGEPGFDFIQQVPTTWDEIQFLKGEVGEFVVIAKRKGKQWFLGAMTNELEREISVRVGFLAEDRYRMDAWSDVDAQKPDLLKKEQIFIRSGDTIQMRLVSGGGQVLRLMPDGL